MGYLQYATALVMIALFSIAIIGFTTNFGSDNNAPINIADDPELVILEIDNKENLSTFREGSQSTYKSIVESSIETGETTPSGGQFAIAPPPIIKSTGNIIKVGYIKIFGSGSGFGIFLTTFIAMIFFITALLIWKAWIGRTPD